MISLQSGQFLVAGSPSSGGYREAASLIWWQIIGKKDCVTYGLGYIAHETARIGS